MAFRDFTLDDVRDRFGIAVRDGVLFPDPKPTPVAVRPEIAEFVRVGATLADLTDTEKGNSEFVIAPILLERWRLSGRQFNLFSGVEWNFDRDRGLNGVCDFLLTWGPTQHVLSPPFAVVVESKRYEFHSGFGQCVAAMYAAQQANARAAAPSHPVFGAVTYGDAWKFLRLDGPTLTLDTDKYTLDNLPQLLAVLDVITRRPAALAA